MGRHAEVKYPDMTCPFCHHVGCGTKGFTDLGKIRYRCYGCGKSWNDNTDKELIRENVRYKKQTQKYADINRIERKSFREDSRIENALEEYNKGILQILQNYDLSKQCKIHAVKNSTCVGIVTLADLHLNELVDEISNKFDFKIASKRLQLFAVRTIQIFKSYGIKNILIAGLGDFLNSNRRLDELLNQATNRSNATMLSVHIIKQFIIHLNQFFNITYASITGNESRISEESGFSKILATDNFDDTIFNILRYIFEGTPINFIIGDKSELIVDVNGQKVLLLHGNTITSDVTKSITQIKGKYADKGILIDYILIGHIHESRIADTYSRSSSLVGDNAYSFKGLNLTGRASQNIHVFHSDKNRDSFKIDLQHTKDIAGYEIIEELEAYNAKSADKVKERHTIFSVVI